MIKYLVLIFFLFSLVGCITAPPPNDEYTYAKLAIDYAKAVHAVKYSPGYWHEAEEYYRRAKILYSEREYEKASDLFKRARQSAEKAENSARLLKIKNGDIL